MEEKLNDTTRKIIGYYKNGQLNNLRRLGEIAEIIRPKVINKNNEVKKLTANDLAKNGYDNRDFKKGSQTDTYLNNGDIIFGIYGSQVGYINEDLAREELCAGGNDFVIRVDDEYADCIFLYLQSEIAKALYDVIIQELLDNNESVSVRIKRRALESLPIPNVGNNYKNFYNTRRLVTKETYSFSMMRMLASSTPSPVESIETPEEVFTDAFFTEMLKRAVRSSKTDFREQYIENTNELRSCYKRHYNKAAACLAGSILEGILLDWLYDLAGSSYKKSKYLGINGKSINKKALNLNLYKKELKTFYDGKKPQKDWETIDEKIEFIQLTRNRIHITHKEPSVSNEECSTIIQYLDDISKARTEDKYFIF